MLCTSPSSRRRQERHWTERRQEPTHLEPNDDRRNSIPTWQAPSKQLRAQINVSCIFTESSSLRRRQLPPLCSSPCCHYPRNRWRHQRKRGDRRGNATNHLVQAVVVGGDDANVDRGHLQQRQHSNHLNKRVKWGADADVSEKYRPYCTRQKSSSVLAGGWFGQLDQARQHLPVFEPTQNTSPAQLFQPSEVSQRLLIHPGLSPTRRQDAGGSGCSAARYSDP